MLDSLITISRAAIQGDIDSIHLLIAIYILLVCGYSSIYQSRMRRWPCVMGRLCNLGVEKFGAGEWNLSDQNYIGHALYEYEVKGQRYEGRRISPWVIVTSHNLRGILSRQLAKLKPGPNGEITVYYCASNPRKCVLLLPGLAGLWLTIVIGITPIIHYIL